MSKEFVAHSPKPGTLRGVAPNQDPEAAASAEEKKRAFRAKRAEAATKRPKEIGGPTGPEPTRYGDWERKGICSDF